MTKNGSDLIRERYRQATAEASKYAQTVNHVLIGPVSMVSPTVFEFVVEGKMDWHSRSQVLERVRIEVPAGDAVAEYYEEPFTPIVTSGFFTLDKRELTAYEAFSSGEQTLVVGKRVHWIRALEATASFDLSKEVAQLAKGIYILATQKQLTTACAYAGVEHVPLDYYYEPADYTVGQNEWLCTREEAMEEFGKPLVHGFLTFKAITQKEQWAFKVPFSAVDGYLASIENTRQFEDAIRLYGEYVLAFVVRQRKKEKCVTLGNGAVEAHLYAKVTELPLAQTDLEAFERTIAERVYNLSATPKYRIAERENRIRQHLPTLTHMGLRVVQVSPHIVLATDVRKDLKYVVYLTATDMYVRSDGQVTTHVNTASSGTYAMMEEVAKHLRHQGLYNAVQLLQLNRAIPEVLNLRKAK